MDVTTEDPTDIDASRPPELKKSTKKANTKSKAHYDEVNVLVTGFGVRVNSHPSQSPLMSTGY
jgi:hypothetical protein